MLGQRSTSVLLVESDPRSREALAQALRREGFQASVCADPGEASHLLHRYAADAVCVGLRTPGAGEIDLIRQVRAAYPDAVILAHSPYANVDAVIETFKAGAADFLTRPDRLDEFVFKLKRLLLQRALSREDRTLAPQEQASAPSAMPHSTEVSSEEDDDSNLRHATRAFERRHVLKVLAQVGFDKHAAAHALGIGLSSLYRKMDELCIPLRTPGSPTEPSQDISCANAL